MWNNLAVAVLISLFAVGFSETCYFDYNFTNDSTVTPCVQMNISSTIGIRYLKDEDKIGFVSMKVPCTHNATHPSSVSGTCNITGGKTSISISWSNDTSSDPSNNLTFYFEKSKSGWKVANMTFVADVSMLDDAKSTEETVTGHIKKSIFDNVKNGRAYYCKSKNNLTLTIEGSDDRQDFNMSVALDDFKVQAFGFSANDTANQYGQVARCSQDIKGSKIVPIAVGAALAGLVVIVLIAYIIGRLRSRRQSSYEALS